MVRAPLVERPVAKAPEIEIDPPGIRARREAALELATMPDDPWTFAESLAAPAAAAKVDKARCGSDQRPQVDEAVAGSGAEANLSKPAGLGYLAAAGRLDAALRSSSDSFDRQVADWMNLGDALAPGARAEVLAQRAATTSDPRVYALAYRTCQGLAPEVAAAMPSQSGGSCASLTARRWVELDPGNGVPWLFVYWQASESGDATAQQEALTQMASSSRFQDRMHAAAGAIAAHASHDDDDLAADYDLSVRAFQMAAGQFDPINPLLEACGDKAAGDANRAQQCQAISEVMFDHGDDLLLHAFGGILFFHATGDSSRREAIRAERIVMAKHWSPATGFSECATIRDGLKSMVRSAQIGELEAMRERARVFVTP